MVLCLQIETSHLKSRERSQTIIFCDISQLFKLEVMIVYAERTKQSSMVYDSTRLFSKMILDD